jgi:FkbM family methyltransferase|tara:strand:- start:2054 stop:2863 length:810 start_codon:yes stop_codon:yes gene_type:complete
VNNDLQVSRVRVSGIEVEIAGAVDDLYFNQCSEKGNLFEPAVKVAELMLDGAPVIFDIGASIGGVTAALATLFPSGRVIAFEAAPSVHASLRETILRCGGAPISLVECAVGQEPGELRFHEDGNGSGWGFLSDELGAIAVPVTTVDETVKAMGIDRVDFIKIDVEGGELDVLRGAEKTLLRDRPLLVFEVNVFCLWRYGRTLPQDLFAWVLDRYPHAAMVDSMGAVTPIDGDATVNHILHLLGRNPEVVDVIASHEPLDISSEDFAVSG